MLTVELDPHRLRLLTARLASDSGTLWMIRRQLEALSSPAMTRPYLERALGFTVKIDDAATATADLAHGVIDDATGADQAVGGFGATLAGGGFQPPWWSRSRYDPGSAAVEFDFSQLDDPVELRSALTTLEARLGVFAWQVIGPDIRSRLIETCPELVFELIALPGGTLLDAEWDALLTALACDEVTDFYGASMKGIIPWKVDIVVVGGIDLTVVERTDGTVSITFSDNRGVGVGLSTKSPKGNASADGTVGAGESMTFEFDSMEEASKAIDDLRTAATGVVEQVRAKPSGWEWIGAVSPLGAAVVTQRRAVRALTADSVEETLRRYGRHLERVEVEAHIAQAVTGSLNLTSFGSLMGAADGELRAYYSEDTDGDDDYFGVQVGIDLSASAMLKLGIWAGGSGLQFSGATNGSASAEYRRRDDGDDRLILTLDGEATGAVEPALKAPGSTANSGPGAVLPNGGSVTYSDTDGRGASLTIEIPIDSRTKDAADDLLWALATGADPTAALDALYDEADVTLSTRDVSAEAIGISVPGIFTGTLSRNRDTAEDVRRKRPHGDWHSPIELSDQLLEVRPD